MKIFLPRKKLSLSPCLGMILVSAASPRGLLKPDLGRQGVTQSMKGRKELYMRPLYGAHLAVDGGDGGVAPEEAVAMMAVLRPTEVLPTEVLPMVLKMLFRLFSAQTVFRPGFRTLFVSVYWRIETVRLPGLGAGSPALALGVVVEGVVEAAALSLCRRSAGPSRRCWCCCRKRRGRRSSLEGGCFPPYPAMGAAMRGW